MVGQVHPALLDQGLLTKGLLVAQEHLEKRLLAVAVLVRWV